MKEILDLLEKSGAYLNGHFVLTSGRHSDRYVEKIKLVEKPEILSLITDFMVDLILKQTGGNFDVVVSPAFGAITIGFLVALKTGKDFLFTQRKDEKMVIRSGFSTIIGKKVIIVEDIITTGGSVKEVYDALSEKGAEVVDIFCLVDRSKGISIYEKIPVAPLKLDIESWDPSDCPLCKKDIQLTKPGASDKK